MSKEFLICLDEDKNYFPGDVIKGHIKLDLKRSADIQHISLNFKGTAEAHGEKIILLDQTEIFATPMAGEKYTVFKKNEIYTFDFQFKIPKDKSLPSYTRVPKIACISYFLTATPKQRLINFSNSLSTISQPIKIFDFIDVDLPHYTERVFLNNDLGFVNGSKSTQWNLAFSKSAYMKGDTISIECNISNFPYMKKSKAIKLSLVRQVHKISTTKVIEKKVLSLQAIDLHVTEKSTNQSIRVELPIPHDTPVSVFPNTGVIISISYQLQAELNMKGVKSAIKLKDNYLQEYNIVIGTHTGPISLQDTKPSKGNPMAKRANTVSHRHSPVVSQPSFHDAMTDSSGIKPLNKLDPEQAQMYYTQRRSYLTTKSHTPITKDFFVRDLSPEPTTHARHSLNALPPTAAALDNRLSSMRLNGTNTISCIQQTQRKPFLFPREPSNPTISSPHEIGPDDIINRGGGDGDYFYRMQQQQQQHHHHYQQGDEKQQVPGLIRHDTISTASSAEYPSEYHHHQQQHSHYAVNK